MAEPIFNAGLNLTQIKYFEKKIWKALRTRSLADQLASEGANSAIQRVTELTNTTWGMKAVMTLIPDDTSFGTVGDSQLEDREAGLTAHDIDITFDQFRKAFKNEGVMADRTHWFKFVQQASDQLGYWASDIKDRLLINTLAGVGYQYEVDGSIRDGSCEWNQNKFAADVAPPSPNRHFRWDKVNGVVGSPSTGDIEADDLPTWNTFLDMRTELPLMRIKPIRGKWGNGQDLYVCLVHPRTMNVLKKDSTFQENLRMSLQRGDKHPFFQGAETYMVDGILLISHRYAYSTLGAASGQKWGLNGTINGARSMFLGSQAIGMVEMQGPKMVTKQFDYDNRMGVAMNLKFGYKKIQWPDQYAQNSKEDFGCLSLDHAVPAGATHYTI